MCMGNCSGSKIKGSGYTPKKAGAAKRSGGYTPKPRPSAAGDNVFGRPQVRVSFSGKR